MAKKSKIVKPHREMTKRQLSHWQQQQRRQRIIFIAGIAIIAVVLLIVGFGWLVGDYLPMHQDAIYVNGREFNMKYYIDMLRVTTQGRPEYAGYYADPIIHDIEQSELIRQGAAQLEITVSNDDVKKKLNDSQLANTEVYRDIVRTSLLLEKVRDEYFDPKVPQTSDQRHIMAMFLETQSQAASARDILVNSDNFTRDFTEIAGEQSANAYSKSKKGDYGWHSQEILSNTFTTKAPVEYAFSAAVGELSEPIRDDGATKSVGYWVIKVVDISHENSEANLLGMLLGSEEEANNVIARLNAGEDFATIAKERSQTGTAQEDGGDMGAVAKGKMSAAVDSVVFNAATQPDTLVGPIRDETVETKGGYWLVKVVDEQAARPTSTEDRDYLKSKALQEWVDALWADPNNVIDDSALTDEKKGWAVTQAIGG